MLRCCVLIIDICMCLHVSSVCFETHLFWVLYVWCFRSFSASTHFIHQVFWIEGIECTCTVWANMFSHHHMKPERLSPSWRIFHFVGDPKKDPGTVGQSTQGWYHPINGWNFHVFFPMVICQQDIFGSTPHPVIVVNQRLILIEPI